MVIKQFPMMASVLKKMQPWKHLYSSKCSVLHQRWTQRKESNLAVIFYELWVQEVIEYEIAIFLELFVKTEKTHWGSDLSSRNRIKINL